MDNFEILVTHNALGHSNENIDDWDAFKKEIVEVSKKHNMCWFFTDNPEQLKKFMDADIFDPFRKHIE